MKTKKSKQIYINTSIVVPVWKCGIMFWVCSVEQGNKLLKNYGINPDECFISNNQYGKCIQKGTYNPIVWINSDLERGRLISALSHELLHATFFILEQKGVPINYDNSEPFTYLLEFLTEKCLGKLKL